MDLTELKAALRDRIEDLARHLYPTGCRDGRHWVAGDETGSPGKSFRICVYGAMAGMHGDFAGGDRHSSSPLDLWMKASRVDFATACREAREWLGVSGESCERRPAARAIAAPVVTARAPKPEEWAQLATLAHRLRDEGVIRERWAMSRGWRPETLLSLAMNYDLGVTAGGTWAFLYDGRWKERWQSGTERRMAWRGSEELAIGVWRGRDLLQRWPRRVYVSEGETDSISLLDAGAEDDGETLVVAMPSCSTFKEQWVRLFVGRDAVLALDDDEAGQKATKRVVELLTGHARSVAVLDWRAVA